MSSSVSCLKEAGSGTGLGAPEGEVAAGARGAHPAGQQTPPGKVFFLATSDPFDRPH